VDKLHFEKTASSIASRPAGFTLIEVLIAVLVMSIGLLGLASLQATSLRFNNDSSAQTQAAYLASDMADRMRANVSRAADYPGKAAGTNANCYTVAGCSPDEMAANDIAEWEQALATLPSGQGTITALAGGLFTITVMWDEQRSGVTGTNCNPNNPNDLRCISITTQP
jgi:type IV pilus assembly protein PilV